MTTCREPALPLALLAALLLSGCGASTVRLAAAPSVTSAGKPGFEATLALGVGWPLDLGERSHHFVQAQASVGGGKSSDPRLGTTVAEGIDVDYIHWVEATMDQRAGVHLSARQTGGGTGALVGVGPHVGLLPMVYQNDASWLVTHLCVGPELRADVLWSHATGAIGVFSLPLVVEMNWLAAGD